MIRYLLSISLGVLCFTACRSGQGVLAERRYVAPSATLSGESASVVCELRYYVVVPPDNEQPTIYPCPPVRVVKNDRKTLTCSLPEPYQLLRLADTNLAFHVRGFVLQITAPPAYTGKILIVHFDGPLASGDPFKAFAFAKRYQFELSPAFIGNAAFRLCY